MNDQEKVWFAEIAKNRQDAWDLVLSKRAFRNIMRGVVEKYAGMGHFIYELLQNADDVGADEAMFELEQNRLVFRHNGHEHFTVTSLDSEEDENAVTGHLNAITSVGASTKILEHEFGNAIGKFGVGFKAVFKYTNRPEIYDDNMRFALEHYIVPKWITDDFAGRGKGETVFVFPFDREDKSNAREEIWAALQSLVFPTLFLNHLKSVRYRYGGQSGGYRVDCLFQTDLEQDEMSVRKLAVVAKSPSGEKRTPLWMFTKSFDGHRCSVCYAINDAGSVVPVDFFAFCFFPTRHQTKLKFLIHAPFLLNDSREGILAGYAHNDSMVKCLANIAGAGVRYLCKKSQEDGVRIVTDDIVKTIPISREDYGDGISFDAFREVFERLFHSEFVIPTLGSYVDMPHAYWPESIAVPQLFSDEQLQELFEVKNICWAFPSIPRENKSRNVGKEFTSDVFDFIEDCTAECVYDNNVIAKITPVFIEHQPMEWLERLYDWIAANDQRVRKARTAPIFFNQNGLPSAVFGADGKIKLYLPLIGEDRYEMVRSDLLENEHAMGLIEKYKLSTPNKGDWIQLILSNKIADASSSEIDDLVKQVLGYYVSCGNEERKEIAEKLKLHYCWRIKDGGDVLYRANDVYFESPLLHSYFDLLGECKYLNLFQYQNMVAPKYAEDIKLLFKEIGVAKFVRVRRVNIPDDEVEEFYNTHKEEYNLERSTGKQSFSEREIERLPNYLNLLTCGQNIERKKSMSLVLWEMLGNIAEACCSKGQGPNETVASAFQKMMQGKYEYFHWKDRSRTIPSRHMTKLLNADWLLTVEGKFVSPASQSLTGDRLAPDYRNLPCFTIVCGILNIPETDAIAHENEVELQARDALSYGAKYALALGEQASKLGVTLEDIQKLAREKAFRAEELPHVAAPVPHPATTIAPPQGETEKLSEQTQNGLFEQAKAAVRNASEKTKKYLAENRDSAKGALADKGPVQVSEDADPMQPKAVDFEKRAEELQKKVDAQIEQMRIESELQATAVEAEEYSFAWLMARLELEMRASGADDEGHREASVSFAKMEREPGTENTFMLSATSDAIPQWFEEEVNQRLTIRIRGRQNNIETVIESMSVLSFRLRAKVRILPGMENIDWTQVVEAKTAATKPTFLLNALKEGYAGLGIPDAYNLKQNLPESIKFVFGPPGTGKTTYLARNVLMPLAKDVARPHVLVLTPTNKAADVLAKRIIKECGDDESYKQWLTRFGITLDPELQGGPVARAKDVVIDDEHSAVMVTTVIRFAYDSFTSMDKGRVSDFSWDYIVIDEASMIPLMQILYPIYKAKNAKFVIAGDPMQIAPVVRSDLSVGQNIYTMVNLQDFANPTTEPRQYEVVKLDEQFRSVPCIGRIFSEFAYGGELHHHRSAAEEKDLDLQIDGMDPIKPLTVLRYPVSRFESIFKIKLLGMSSYQIYSALFVFEYICKLAEGIRATDRTGFRIGVISPYRAQADIVDRLLAKLDASKLDGIEVHVGTVHSFQGDECEMIIALFNPPQGMGRKDGSFINDRKVLNVAISRARDYLVLAIPDAKTPNIKYLRGPLAVEGLMKQMPGVFAELQTRDMEANVWGDRDYIEKNTYSTGHQSVNVYEIPEKRFEVRSEDSALDIHFRADRSSVGPDDGFVSERARIATEANAEEQIRLDFVIPQGFHKPVEGEFVTAIKHYYIIGQEKPLKCESEMEDIDPSMVLAIED